MPDYPVVRQSTQHVATLDAPRSDSVSRALGIVVATVLIVVTLSGALMLVVFAR